jgi:hypothetical protein
MDGSGHGLDRSRSGGYGTTDDTPSPASRSGGFSSPAASLVGDDGDEGAVEEILMSGKRRVGPPEGLGRVVVPSPSQPAPASAAVVDEATGLLGDERLRRCVLKLNGRVGM